MNGLLNRLLFNGVNLDFLPNTFAPFHPWVYLGTLITSVSAIAAAFFWPTRTLKSKQGGVTDFAIIVLTSTMVSPVAWEHHYGILLPIYAFLLPYFLKHQILGKFTLIYLGISYILASNYFSITNQLAPTPLNIFQSYLFFAAGIVLTCLYSFRSVKVRKDKNIIAAEKLAQSI